jgi:hypothetical protein
MKDHIYLVSLQFIEEVRKIFELPGETGFIARLGLLSGLKEQELVYVRERTICYDAYGCDCVKLHVVIVMLK